jgi:hypothetical protein
MKSYSITGPNGDLVATLVCDGLLSDLNEPNEHVIPFGDPEVQAVRIVLGENFILEES